MRFINFFNGYIGNITIVFLIYFVDRLSKIYILYLEKKSLTSELFVSKYLNIVPIWNKGISFGLLSLNDEKLYLLLTAIIFFIILVLIFMVFKNRGIKKIALLAIIGGAIGNLHDRLQFRAVLDFIDFHVGNFHWFIFNVSDIFISMGVAVIIILELRGNSKKNVNQNL